MTGTGLPDSSLDHRQSKAEVHSSFITTTVREQHPRSHQREPPSIWGPAQLEPLMPAQAQAGRQCDSNKFDKLTLV